MPIATRVRTEAFSLTWEGPTADDGEPDQAHFLGNSASAESAVGALVAFAATAHSDWHGGLLAVRDNRGDLVFAARLPLCVPLVWKGQR
jgi:hypothetical protein